MGIAALVLGCIALITSWIPFVCFIAFILAIIGLILGIVDSVKKSKANDNKKWFGIVGLIISAIAIPIIIFSSIVSIGAIIFIVDGDYNDWEDDYYDYYYDYNYDDEYDDWYEDWYDEFYHELYNNQLNSHNTI